MYSYEKEDFIDGGYSTPVSFKRPKGTDSNKEGTSKMTSEQEHCSCCRALHCQQQSCQRDVEYDKMSNQVYGINHSYYQNQNSHRPDPIAGKDRDVHERQAYESSRHPVQEMKTYRSGQPDVGSEPTNDTYVPPHPGWILLLRFHKDGEVNVRRALTMCAKHIASDSGRILGLARSHEVCITEGGDAWTTFMKMRHVGCENMDVYSPETNYCILAIYYASLARAIQWFDRDSCFKQKDFPVPYTTDCIALPLTSSIDTKNCKTLVMTEYPKISHADYFREQFSIPTEDMMLSRFKASPYVVKTTSVPIDDPRQSVARHLRGSWIKRNSIITVSMFDSMQEALRYITDEEYIKCKQAQDKVSSPTTVIMDLEDWKL